MDGASVEVLARKDFLLRNYLLWNDELTDELREKLVLSEKNVEGIKVCMKVVAACMSSYLPL